MAAPPTLLSSLRRRCLLYRDWHYRRASASAVFHAPSIEPAPDRVSQNQASFSEPMAATRIL